MNRTQRVGRSVVPLVLSLLLGVSPRVAAAMQRADSVLVTGLVTSAGGVPIPSAVVAISHLRLSTQTNDAGRYRLLVPAAARAETLHVTRLGYRPADVAVHSRGGSD